MTENKLTAAQMLYEARTVGRRKREIQTISKLLCIREEYLIALEKGNYHLIPEVVYILGFARNYAIELGLDPDEIVSKIKSELGLAEEQKSGEASENADREEAENKVAAAKKKAGPAPEQAAESAPNQRRKWLLIGFIGLVIIVAGIFLAASVLKEPAIQPLGDGASAPQVVTTAPAAVKEPEFKVAVRERFGTENRASARIVIQANQESWVKIEDARGNTVFSRVLVAGDIYYVPGGDKLKGTFGKAGVVDIWVDGVMAPKQGAVHARKAGIPMTPEALVAEEAE